MFVCYYLAVERFVSPDFDSFKGAPMKLALTLFDMPLPALLVFIKTLSAVSKLPPEASLVACSKSECFRGHFLHNEFLRQSFALWLAFRQLKHKDLSLTNCSLSLYVNA